MKVSNPRKTASVSTSHIHSFAKSVTGAGIWPAVSCCLTRKLLIQRHVVRYISPLHDRDVTKPIVEEKMAYSFTFHMPLPLKNQGTDLFSTALADITSHIYSLWPSDAICRHKSGSNWLCKWLVVWRYQSITAINVDQSSVRSCGIHPRAILRQVPKLVFYKMGLKIIPWKWETHLPGANQSMIVNLDMYS